MKTRILILLTCLLNAGLFAQQQTSITCVREDAISSKIKIHCGSLQQQLVETPLGTALKITINQGHSILVKGAPDLPSLSFSIQIPNHASGRVEIVEANYEDINTPLIAPSKGNLTRDIKPNTIPYTFGKEYNINQFYPSVIAEVQTPYILRDVAGQSIQLFPIQYNPIQGKLRVYSDITINVIYDQAPANGHEQLSNSPIFLNEDFQHIYENHFLNYNKKNTRYSPITEIGKMLILCPSTYLNSMKPFIEWKQRKGIQTIVVKTDTIPGGVTETNLKNFVAAKYGELHFAYLLLVGDNMHIPPQNEFYSLPNLAGPSDIAYAYISGNDHYPEFCVGRLSAENNAELDVQVAKVLHYEKMPNTNGTWMQTQIGIASAEGPGDDNQYDFEHIGVIVDSNKLMNLFTNQSELFDGTASNGTYDAAGDPTAQMLADKINAGASLINYTGHGSSYGIVTTQFGNSEVSLLNNTGKLPFFLTVGCSPGQFGGQTCFAENMQRAGTSTTPYGSIANFMSSINQYWDEPMEAQDEFNAVLRGAKPNNLKHRLGPLCVDACAQMNDAYNTASGPTDGSDMTDTWIFFGDPSVALYTKNTGTLTCTHTSEIGRHSTWYSVNCPVDGATIGLYYQGNYLASSLVSGGVATFSFPDLQNLDTVFITATKENYTPYQGFTKVVDFPTNVSTLLTSNQVLVYPIPTDNFIRIEAKAANRINGYTLFDLNGKIIRSVAVNNLDQVEIPMAELSNGTYLLSVNTLEGNIARTIEKK